MLNRYSWEGGVPPEGLGKLSRAGNTERGEKKSLPIWDTGKSLPL